MLTKHNYKLTAEQFIDVLIECNGILSHVPKAIYNKYGISYSRQTVYERAQNFTKELKQIRETVVDYSEARLIKCINDDSDIKLSVKVAQYILDRLGKDRGYGKNGADKILDYKPEEVFDIDDEVFHFKKIR